MANVSEYGVRRFGRANWLGVWTLIKRENMRYLAIWQQTIFAPLVTAGLFLLVFSVAIGPNRADVMGFSYVAFLAPGLLMMTVIHAVVTCTVQDCARRLPCKVTITHAVPMLLHAVWFHNIIRQLESMHD